MESVSYNYMDNYGNSYLGLSTNLDSVFRKLNITDIERNIRQISVKYTLAQVELSVRVLASRGEEHGYIIGNAGSPQTIMIKLDKPSGKWLIISVEGIFDKTALNRESNL